MLFLLLMLIEVFSFAIKLIKPIANEILYIGIEDAKSVRFWLNYSSLKTTPLPLSSSAEWWQCQNIIGKSEQEVG
jgi:hypothetical protein